jgi:hypothetical protein
MPSGFRRNPSRRERVAQRANRARERDQQDNSEFLQVLQLQLNAVTSRESARRREQLERHLPQPHSRSRSRSRSPSPYIPQPATYRSRSPAILQPSAYQSRTRARSPLESRPERRFRTRSPIPQRSPAPRLDLNPREEVGRTARPSPEEDAESVLGWTAFSQERDRQITPHNPFTTTRADTYRPNYNNRGQRGNRPARRGRGSTRGSNRGRAGERSLFDRINL